MEYMVVNSYMDGAYVACINHTHTGASHAAAAAILPARGQPSRHVRSILGGERSCPPPYGASGIAPRFAGSLDFQHVNSTFIMSRVSKDVFYNVCNVHPLECTDLLQ